MAGASPIEWTDATWNPVVGCSIDTPGCINCYAMPMARRIEAMTAALKLSGATGAPHYDGTTRVVKGKAVWTGKLALAPDHILTEPLTWKKPRRIFVNSMGDLFHEDAPDEWIDRVFAVMALCPQHTFQVLTKRSARMREYFAGRRANFGRASDILHEMNHWLPEPRHEAAVNRLDIFDSLGKPLPNVWLGVSAEDQARADRRIPDLLATPATVRFVSAEPLIGPIDFYRTSAAMTASPHPWRNGPILQGIDWIIVGGESGPKARPMHPAWARRIRDQCAAAGVPFFFKQWGSIGEWNPRCPSHPRPDMAFAEDGRTWTDFNDIPFHTPVVFLKRMPKSRAGRLLDGTEHNGFPAGRPSATREAGGGGAEGDGGGLWT